MASVLPDALNVVGRTKSSMGSVKASRSSPCEMCKEDSIERGNKEQRPLVGVGVVFIRDGMIFLAKRSGSHGAAIWGVCGGHLEFGESLEACARREAKEELGVM
ncbi:MAG: hypothetical protein CM1200mP15_20500 [Dehalococcoidia bacterium]|nr:MAG: hypothetical protein CM1200mP15_20500 [Dehalococcoidia bacterium]